MIRGFAILVLALLLGAIGGAWYLAGTTGGLQRLADLGAGRLPGQLMLEGLDGSLLTVIHVDRVVYRQDAIDVVASDVTLQLDASRLAQRIVAIDQATASSVMVGGVPADVRVRLAGTARLRADLPLDVTVDWSVREKDFRGRGRFTGTLERLAFSQVVELPEPVRIDGVVLQIARDPSVSATVRWEHLTLPEQGFGALVSRDGETVIEANPDTYRLHATTVLIRDDEQRLTAALAAHGDTGALVIDSLELEGLGGQLQAAGKVDFETPSRVRLELSGRDFDPGVLFPGYDGRLDFAASVEAQWPERLVAKVARLDGEFLGSPIGGHGDLLVENGEFRRADARLRSAGNKLRLIVRAQPRLVGEFEIDAPELAALWPGLSGELHGTGSLTGSREAPQISTDLVGTDIGFGGQHVARVRIVGRADAETGVEFDARAEGLETGGRLLGDLAVTGIGTIEAHELSVSLAGGLASTRFTASGAWDGQRLEERIEAAVVDTEIGSWHLRDTLTLMADGGGATVSGHCWDSFPAIVCTEGLEVRGEQLTVDAALERFPLETLNPWLGEGIALQGEADATFALTRDADGFRATADWVQQDTRLVFGSAVEEMMVESEVETRLSRLELQLAADDEQAVLTGSVSGAFGLLAEIEARLETPLRDDGALSGALRAEVPDIRELRPLVDRYIPTEGLAGALLVDVRLGGTRANPTLDGSASLREAAATIPLFGITVTDIGVQVRSDGGDQLSVTGSARSGEGTIALTGAIAISRDAGLYADIAIQGERFQLIRLPDQTALISPDMTAHFDAGRIEVAGRVLVPEATFELRELGAAAVAVSDDVVVYRTGEDARPSASYSRIAGQLDIELGDAVTFTGFGLATRLTGGLLLTFRPGAMPAGEGSFQLIDGSYEAFGRAMQIERGSLNFFGPLDDPVVDARATRRFRYEAQDIKLGIHLSGRLSQQLEFSLFSEPAMSEADVLSFMVVGRPSSSGDESAVSGAALAMGLQSLAATRRVGDTLTLDEISFEGRGPDDTAVVAGKRISDNWYIRYTYGLFNRVGTFIIRYDIGRGVSVEAGSGAQQSLDLIYSVDR